MATQGLAYGLRPIGMASGGPLEVSNVYAKPASDANPIFMFDIVQKTATSSARPEGGQPAPGCRGGNLGTAGTGLWLGASLNHGAASTLTKHVVADDPKTVFLAQSDKATAATIAAVVGKNANMVVSGGSNAQLGPKGNLQSGMVLNDATVATTTGLDVRILRWLNSPENPDSAAFPLLEVMIVLHQYEQQATTAV